MSDNSIKTLAAKEVRRLTKLLKNANVSDARMNGLKSIIDNVAWMKIKLDDARESIKTSSVVIPYDNGGGQMGLRENPLFKGYESLWKSYMSGMEKILATLPPEVAKAEEKAEEKPKTILELVRNKHQKGA